MISIWEKETFFAQQDFTIVGSGFVGLWCAYYLKKKWPSLAITILEKGFIPSGASTRNAGFACFGSVSELIYDAKTMGEDKMLQLVSMRYEGLKEIMHVFNKEEIDFEWCGGYELYSYSDGISDADLTQHLIYLNKVLKEVTKTTNTFKKVDEKIPAFQFGQTKQLLYNNLEGSLHPGKLIKALLQKVQAAGVQVFTGTDVLAIENMAGKFEIKTNKPYAFYSNKVVVCTNAFAKQLLPQIDVVPARGQVLVTSPINNLPWKGTFHSDEGYIYFRNLQNRILLGGARNKAMVDEGTAEQGITPIIQTELEKYLHTVILPRYKQSYSIDYRWSGIMAMGGEKMPIVQQLQPGLFCAVRMSGMGVALAPIVARQITSMLA